MLLTLQQFDGQRPRGRRERRRKRRRPSKEDGKGSGRRGEGATAQCLHRPRVGRREAADGELEARGVGPDARAISPAAAGEGPGDHQDLSPGQGARRFLGRRQLSRPITWSSRSRFATSAARPHKVAYRLDGPNGLPTEGKWYATRVTRSGGSGLRDFIISFGGRTPGMVGAIDHRRAAKFPPPWPTTKPLTFIGVDAQYFSAVLMPQRDNPGRRLVRGPAAHSRGQGRSAAHEPHEHVVPPDRQGAAS